MGKLITPTEGLVFASVLYQPGELSHEDLLKIWKQRYKLDGEFAPEFNPSKEYYSKEMGVGLERVLFWDKRPFPREELVLGKLWADSIEQEKLINGARLVNIDIGMVFKEQVLLSTSKPYSHRIYLRDGVHAELTYTYENKSYHFLPWTYPDYQHQEKLEFFNSLRKRLF